MIVESRDLTPEESAVCERALRDSVTIIEDPRIKALERELEEVRDYGIQARRRENAAEEARVSTSFKLTQAEWRIEALERERDGLRHTVASLYSEKDAAEAERDRLREVLEEAAKQSTSDEIGATDREYHDFEGAYNQLVLNARATLHPIPTREGGGDALTVAPAPKPIASKKSNDKA